MLRSLLPLILVFALFPAIPPGAEERHSVLLVTIDTLRADRVGTALTPHINAVAREGTLFRNAVTPVPLTLPAHSSLLTGLYPMYHGVRDFTGQGLGPEFPTVAEIYRAAGYRTAAFVSAFVLDSIWGLDRGFQVYYDHFEEELEAAVQPGRIERRGDDTVDQVLKWLSEPSAEPFFLWVHLFDPHSAYEPPEPYRTRFAGRLYDGEVAFADAQLGRLLDHLRRRGLYEKTVIVITSDHGESLGEHGEMEHGFFLYDATVRVPLVVKVPGLGGNSLLDAPVSLVDIAPTLLQISRLRSPGEMQGEGFLALLSNRSRAASEGDYLESLYPLRSFGWSPLRAYRTSSYKFIDAPRPELYDLRRDPGETKNLFEEQTALAFQLQDRLQKLAGRFQGRPQASRPPLPPEALEKLKALGYVAYRGAPREPSSPELRADPKDKIGVFNQILRAMDLSQLGRLEESSRLLQEILQQEPSLFTARNLLGQNHLRLGQPVQAAEEFRAALTYRPDWEEAVFNLARAYWAQGNREAARLGFEQVLQLDPDNFLARFNLGSLLMSESLPRAVEEFREAEKLRPTYPLLQRNLGAALADLKRFAEAETHLLQARDLNPQDPITRNYLGIVYRNTGRPQLAVQEYEQALRLDPEYTAAYLNLAFAYRDQGDLNKAQQTFQTFCRKAGPACRQYQDYFTQGTPRIEN